MYAFMRLNDNHLMYLLLSKQNSQAMLLHRYPMSTCVWGAAPDKWLSHHHIQGSEKPHNKDARSQSFASFVGTTSWVWASRVP